MKLGRHKWIIVLAIAVVAVGALWLWQRSKEPRYQGRTVRQWIEIVRPTKTYHTNVENIYSSVDFHEKELVQMLNALGTNAAPALIQILDEADSTMTKLKAAVTRSKLVPDSVKSAASEDLSERFAASQIAYGIRILGSNATPVIPDLERIICDPDKPLAASSAYQALSALGAPALPALHRLLTNAPSALRPWIHATIQNIYRNSLNSENAREREEAALALSEYSRPPFEIIQVLLDMLESPDPKRQKQSLDALAVHLPTMDPVLIAARDALAKATASSDPSVRQQANTILANLGRMDSKQKP